MTTISVALILTFLIGVVAAEVEFVTDGSLWAVAHLMVHRRNYWHKENGCSLLVMGSNDSSIVNGYSNETPLARRTCCL